jgi:2-alkyl-3-oxoalkanoate reductase
LLARTDLTTDIPASLENARVLVTGASGLLGSHLAELWTLAGASVRVILRSERPTPFLDRLGVEYSYGDLTDPRACRVACQGVDFVCHAAAKVGDWGQWDDFQHDTIEATRQIAVAAKVAGVRRFVQISSTSAYGHPPDSHAPIREDYPLGQNIWRKDPYTLAKVECERQLWGLAENGLRLTVLRPSWLYGPRDRITLARIIGKLKSGKFRLIGPGDNRISAVDASEVARAALLACATEAAEGEAFNITDLGEITQAEYFGMMARAIGMEPVRRTVNYRLAFAASIGMEMWGRTMHAHRPPLLTRYSTWLMGRRLWYDNTKIRETLGWKPLVDYQTSLSRAVAWYLSQVS